MQCAQRGVGWWWWCNRWRRGSRRLILTTATEWTDFDLKCDHFTVDRGFTGSVIWEGKQTPLVIMVLHIVNIPQESPEGLGLFFRSRWRAEWQLFDRHLEITGRGRCFSSECDQTVQLSFEPWLASFDPYWLSYQTWIRSLVHFYDTTDFSFVLTPHCISKLVTRSFWSVSQDRNEVLCFDPHENCFLNV